jgi:Tfp pilus assembly protein PilN
MQRPNLAGKPFLNTRPVWLAGIVMAVVALILSAISITDAFTAHSSERLQAQKLQSLLATRAELLKKIDAANRDLARVPWKKLQVETSSLQGVVARRQLSWSTLLVDLEQVLPWDTRLTSIRPSILENGGIGLSLAGVAATRQAWLHLIAVLFTDPRFSDPVPLSEEAPASSGIQGYVFQLKVTYWPGGRP